MKKATRTLLAWAREQRRWHPKDPGSVARTVNRRLLAEWMHERARPVIRRILLEAGTPKHYLDPPVFGTVEP